jgi:hypothetical protein
LTDELEILWSIKNTGTAGKGGFFFSKWGNPQVSQTPWTLSFKTSTSEGVEYIDAVIKWREPEDTVAVCVRTLYLSSFIWSPPCFTVQNYNLMNYYFPKSCYFHECNDYFSQLTHTDYKFVNAETYFKPLSISKFFFRKFNWGHVIFTFTICKLCIKII